MKSQFFKGIFNKSNGEKYRAYIHIYPIICLGGAIFCAIFWIAYQIIPADFYAFRDDGVITFSHAKNWVDYGFIGINPSGERVEAYSAPIQFLLFAVAYLFTNIAYQSFVVWQTWICTFVLGCIFCAYFISSPRFSLLATVVTAVGLTLCTSFIEWHASGMENAITHTLFAASVYLLYYFSLKKQIQFSWVWIFLCASLSRLDGIYHIFPLLLIFALYWSMVQRSPRGWYFALIFLILWFGFQFWRLYYFGSLESNTLLAQNINLFGRIKALATLQTWYLRDSWQLSKNIFFSHGGILLLLAVPMMLSMSWSRSQKLLFALSMSLVLTAIFNPFLFGETRLDLTRSTTQMAFFVFVAFFCVAQGCIKRWLKYLLLIALIPVLYIYHAAPYYLCCGVNSFEKIYDEFLAIAKQEKLFRPTVANPDLGLMSWKKDFNIVDIGMLGSPIFAKIRQGPLLAEYFFEYISPDLIESHETWSCQYSDSIFSDPRFRERYRAIREVSVQYGNCGKIPLPKGIWIRRDIESNSNSAERRLLNDLQANLTIDRIKSELKACQDQEKNPKDCLYIARSAYRLIPEFRKSGQHKELINVFEGSRTRSFDQYLLNGFMEAQAYKKALSLLIRSYFDTHSEKLVKTPADYLLGIDRGYLIITNNQCDASAVKDPFFIEQKSQKSSNQDIVLTKKSFNFLQNGFKVGSICIASIPLGQYKESGLINVGQWMPKNGNPLWNHELSLGYGQ